MKVKRIPRPKITAKAEVFYKEAGNVREIKYISNLRQHRIIPQ